MSPFFTIYGGILLILQYLVGFKVRFDQLHLAYDRRTMEQIGLLVRDFQPAFISLLLKVRQMRAKWNSFVEFESLLVLLYVVFLVNFTAIYQ